MAELASNFAIILEEPASKGKAQQRTSASNHSKKNQIQHMYGYQKKQIKKVISYNFTFCESDDKTSNKSGNILND